MFNTSFDAERLLRFEKSIRLYFMPFIDLIGIISNLLFSIIIISSLSYRRVKKKNNNKERRLSKFNSSISSNSMSLVLQSNNRLKISNSACIYFIAIAFLDIGVIVSSLFERGWIKDIFYIDPVSVSNTSCKIYQFIFKFFCVASSW
jgi:hypothetical protein